MARILHLDDDPGRHNVIREALVDHCVSSVSTLGHAQTTLRDAPGYDLALVGVASTFGPDRTAGELLEILVIWHPSVHRVVLTDWRLPPGETASMFDRYSVDVIIDCEGRTAQQLGRAVGNAVAANQRRIPRQTKIHRSE